MADEAIDIGKGLMRKRVRSKKKREKAATIHNVIVDGKRVIFPASLFGAVMAVMGNNKKGKKTTLQMSIEWGEEE